MCKGPGLGRADPTGPLLVSDSPVTVDLPRLRRACRSVVGSREAGARCRVLLRRNVIDAETAQLVTAAVQAALEPGYPSGGRRPSVFPPPIASRPMEASGRRVHLGQTPVHYCIEVCVSPCIGCRERSSVRQSGRSFSWPALRSTSATVAGVCSRWVPRVRRLPASAEGMVMLVIEALNRATVECAGALVHLRACRCKCGRIRRLRGAVPMSARLRCSACATAAGAAWS